MTINAYLSRRDLMAAAATLAAAFPARNLSANEQAAPLAKGDTGARIARGAVFKSRSGARERQAGDPGIGGVLVSNGREVVRTGPDGRYSLPIEDGTAVFVIKPSDYAVPLDEETRLPRFSYIHQPARNSFRPRPPLSWSRANRALAQIRRFRADQDTGVKAL